MSTQRKFVLGDRPTLALATVEYARVALTGHDEDDIKALWEEGLILYAWNIASPGAAIDARILPDCIEHYRKTGSKTEYPRTEEQVAAELMRALRVGDKPAVTVRALRLVLNCSSTQVYNLISQKVMKTQPGTTWSTGPKGSALITVESVKQFFTARRLP